MQAEDGIRDGHVTGVQTCARPILSVAGPVPLSVSGPWEGGGGVGVGSTSVEPTRTALRAFSRNRARSSVVSKVRSEERRVGKECGARWWSEENREQKSRLPLTTCM